jgi:hypothetical protein
VRTAQAHGERPALARVHRSGEERGSASGCELGCRLRYHHRRTRRGTRSPRGADSTSNSKRTPRSALRR